MTFLAKAQRSAKDAKGKARSRRLSAGGVPRKRSLRSGNKSSIAWGAASVLTVISSSRIYKRT